jgi:peptidoglycan hydrolase CwlO-like protein
MNITLIISVAIALYIAFMSTKSAFVFSRQIKDLTKSVEDFYNLVLLSKDNMEKSMKDIDCKIYSINKSLDKHDNDIMNIKKDIDELNLKINS